MYQEHMKSGLCRVGVQTLVGEVTASRLKLQAQPCSHANRAESRKHGNLIVSLRQK